MTETPTLTANAEGQNTIGLTLEDVRTLLSKAHNTSIPENDPLLMIVTINNAFLGEVQKLHARHEQGLSRLMAEKTDAYVSGVKATVDQLSESLSSASVEGVRKIFDAHAATLNAFKYAVYWAAAIVAVSALLNVAVFVLRGIR
jgi:hypothetical protein